MSLDTLIGMIGSLDYRDDIPKAAADYAKSIRAAIIYGYSDDGIMIEGITDDQAGAAGDEIVWVDQDGFLPIDSDMGVSDAELETLDDCRKLLRRFDRSVKIQILEDESEWFWEYKTDWPHRTFEITEDGNPWCKGIVFLFPRP